MWDTCHMVMVIKTKEVCDKLKLKQYFNFFRMKISVFNIDNFFSIVNSVIRHSVTFGSFKYSL